MVTQLCLAFGTDLVWFERERSRVNVKVCSLNLHHTLLATSGLVQNLASERGWDGQIEKINQNILFLSARSPSGEWKARGRRLAKKWMMLLIGELGIFECILKAQNGRLEEQVILSLKTEGTISNSRHLDWQMLQMLIWSDCELMAWSLWGQLASPPRWVVVSVPRTSGGRQPATPNPRAHLLQQVRIS